MHANTEPAVYEERSLPRSALHTHRSPPLPPHDMPTRYLHRVIDIKTFDHADWLNDSSTTVTDALVAILFYTRGQPCVEDGQSITFHDFFGSCQETLTTKIHIPDRAEYHDMSISRYDIAESLRTHEGPPVTRTRAMVTFSTTRKVGLLRGPVVTGELLQDSTVECRTPQSNSSDITPTFFTSKERLEAPNGKVVAASMLRDLQELEKAGYPERESSEDTSEERLQYARKLRSEAEVKKAEEKEEKERKRKRENTKSDKKTGQDKKRKARKGRSAEESETGDSDAEASNKEESAEVGAKTQSIGEVHLPDTVANDTVVDNPGENA